MCPRYRARVIKNAIAAQQVQNGPNKLERAGSAILKSLRVRFREQVPIAGKFVVDVYVPSALLIIQWDGDYWHGYRAVDDTTPLTARQQHRRNIDTSQTAYFVACGYQVLRFWEHEVHKNPEWVGQSIREAMSDGFGKKAVSAPIAA